MTHTEKVLVMVQAGHGGSEASNLCPSISQVPSHPGQLCFHLSEPPLPGTKLPQPKLKLLFSVAHFTNLLLQQAPEGRCAENVC